MKLPVISGLKLAKFLSKFGYEIDHQTGSHLILRLNKYPFTRIAVPMHKELKLGTLLAILRQAGIERKELEGRLRK